MNSFINFFLHLKYNAWHCIVFFSLLTGWTNDFSLLWTPLLYGRRSMRPGSWDSIRRVKFQYLLGNITCKSARGVDNELGNNFRGPSFPHRRERSRILIETDGWNSNSNYLYLWRENGCHFLRPLGSVTIYSRAMTEKCRPTPLWHTCRLLSDLP